jgi:hypothetical protein
MKKNYNWTYSTNPTHLDTECIAYELLGPIQYEGIIYHYNRVWFTENGDSAILNFTYTILDNNEKEIQNKQEFHTILGDVLTEIIDLHEQPSKTNTKQSNSQ